MDLALRWASVEDTTDSDEYNSQSDEELVFGSPQFQTSVNGRRDSPIPTSTAAIDPVEWAQIHSLKQGEVFPTGNLSEVAIERDVVVPVDLQNTSHESLLDSSIDSDHVLTNIADVSCSSSSSSSSDVSASSPQRGCSSPYSKIPSSKGSPSSHNAVANSPNRQALLTPEDHPRKPSPRSTSSSTSSNEERFVTPLQEPPSVQLKPGGVGSSSRSSVSSSSTPTSLADQIHSVGSSVSNDSPGHECEKDAEGTKNGDGEGFTFIKSIGGVFSIM